MRLSEEKVLEALKKGKMVVVVGACESKVKLEYPKDRVEVVVRK